MPSLNNTRSGHGNLNTFALSLQYCTCALIKRATYSFAQVTGVQILVLFQTFGHGVLIIVHVSIGGFVICVKRCSTMRLLAGTAQYLLNCILLAYNCQLWWMEMIHVRV